MVVRALIFRSSRTRFQLCHFLLFVPSHSYQPFPRSHSCHFPISQPHSLSSQTPPASTPLPPAPPTSTEDVNEICRILSDFRAPHHDIELALTPYSSALSANLVEQVLKRTKNLGFSAHRFFFWARRFPGFRPSITNYKILINILGSSKQFPLIWDLLSEMREGESLKLCPDVFWVIFGWYCRADLPNDAIRAFHRMADFGVRPSLNDLDHLLYALCKRGFVRNAQEFFDKVKFQFKPAVKTYSILMRGWGDIADSGSACKLFDEMLEKGCVADVPAYNSLLEALCRGGNVEEAFRFFREMGCKGLDADACTYSIFIRAYCKGDNIYSAFRVLDRMRKYNLLPNVYTYNSVIKKLCMDEKVEEAYLLLDEMVKQGVNPDTWSYNAIQAFHCERCEVNRALGLISRMESANCMPDRHTYNMLLKMLIKVGRFDKVAGVWDGMEARGFYPSVSTYAVMIHGFLKKKGKVEEACKYFEVMIDEGIPPYTSTCELLRNRLLGLGLLEQIDILVNKMKQSTSCSIQELSKTLRGDSSHRSSRREETSESSDDEWVWGSPNNLTT